MNIPINIRKDTSKFKKIENNLKILKIKKKNKNLKKFKEKLNRIRGYIYDIYVLLVCVCVCVIYALCCIYSSSVG